MNGQKIIAVIPAFNEENTIADVVKAVKQHADDVILVDDASTDKTVRIAEDNGAVVVKNLKNLGYDKSINNGFAKAAEMGASVIFTFDADGQHNSVDIPAIVGPIIRGEADVVVGRRPYHARITEYLFAQLAKIKAGVDDPLCGFKAYRCDVYKNIGYFDTIGSIGTQLMFSATKKGYKVIQKDIHLSNRLDSPRFGRRIKANWKIFKAIVKTILS